MWRLGAAAVALACATVPDAPGATEADDSYVAPAPLVGTYWRLIEVAGAVRMSEADPELRAHILLHQEDSRLSGSGGCNRLMGGYELTDDGLEFGPTATTKMACAPEAMTVEQPLLDALDATTGYVIDGEFLTLIGDEGDLARFERYLE